MSSKGAYESFSSYFTGERVLDSVLSVCLLQCFGGLEQAGGRVVAQSVHSAMPPLHSPLFVHPRGKTSFFLFYLVLIPLSLTQYTLKRCSVRCHVNFYHSRWVVVN